MYETAMAYFKKEIKNWDESDIKAVIMAVFIFIFFVLIPLLR